MPNNNMKKDFEILKVKMNNEEFSVGEPVIHNDGNYTTTIVKFCLSGTNPTQIWFYDSPELEFVKDLNNFSKISLLKLTAGIEKMYCPETDPKTGYKPNFFDL